jgi:chromatin remodeling complex protein RSC6
MALRKKTKKRAVRKTSRKPARRTIKKKTAAKKGARKGKAFGGYTINFSGCNHSLADVFGNRPIAPSAMTKKLWAYVKRHKLNLK